MKHRPGDLPADVRAELERATRIPDRAKRLDAIDRARERAAANHPQLFKEQTRMKVQLKNVRLAFPNLFKPTKGANNEGEPAYNAAFIIPKDHPQLKEIRDAMRQVAKDKWGAKAQETYALIEKRDHLALHDGDLKANLAGYEGNFYINARNKTRPTVVDRDKSPLSAEDGKPYSGSYVNVILEFWPQDNDYGKKINASLGGVQFARDGEAFSGGRAASADEFDLEVEAGGDAEGEAW
jgi:hypothetical protein